MDSWRTNMASGIADLAGLAAMFPVETESLRKVIDRYPMRITRHYLELIREPGDPIWLQCVPDPLELSDAQSPDPLDEERLSPLPGLIHRYPDRVVLLVSSECAVYCRFCMRKRRVGCRQAPPVGMADAVAYIASNTAIRDVLLSGGDPLVLSDEEIGAILARLRKIPHVEVIRIGTRIPVVLPERITPQLCAVLKRFHPLYINTHFNHPSEITPASAIACAMLADAGIPLGNQTVLLRNVNDKPEVMRQLVKQLLKLRVRPYYLHQMDLVKGTAHFRTPVDTGIAILQEMRGHVSGLAIPHYVIDLPGGKGKVPVAPDCFRREGGRLLLKNYLGEEISYTDCH